MTKGSRISIKPCIGKIFFVFKNIVYYRGCT
nr:MAG TPA: hypothetical protein [Caudoviricetes sp.]